MPSTAPARPRTRARAFALLTALAAVLLIVPAAAQAAPTGVKRLQASRQVTTGAAATRGLTVKAVVSRRDRALRLRLTRHGKVVARRIFRLHRGGRVTVRWRVRRLRAGQYVLRARSGRSRRALRGKELRARVVVRAPAPSTPTATAPTPTPAASITASTPCGVRSAGAPVRHVVWVVFENKKYEQVIGSPNAPTFNALAAQCGLATAFSAEAHPSLPNYIAMTSGGTQGITDDSGPSSHRLGVPSIFSQVGDWRALQEDMPSNCDAGNTSTYATRHNPAAYYTNLADCAQRDVPLAPTPDLSAKFTFITPNLCHDMHSCPTQSDVATEVRTGDTWLASFLPKVFASPEYTSGTTAVFLTFDESEGGSSQQVSTFVLSPSTPKGARSSTPFTHYALLRTTEELLGLSPYLGAAATAPSMRAAFGL